MTAAEQQAAELILAAGRVCVFTGAGMSAESGIPTFRDALTGMWENYEPEDLATPSGWERDRDLVWGWYADRARNLRAVQPNAGHLAIAELGQRKHDAGGRVSIVTQNVDDLHERAGSRVDAHLHGSLTTPRCERCDHRGGPDVAIAVPRPDCPACGASMRPDVVWFGEMLPEAAWANASDAVSACDVLVIVGTSGVVKPAAQLPMIAADTGTPVIEVNPEPSALTWLTTAYLPGTAAAVLPRVL